MRSSVPDYREFEDGQQIEGTRYRVVRRMGAGGMGTVYEVEHVELGKRFVLKALLRELSRREDLVLRLRNEWRALGRLEHPNIVTVTDAGSTTSGVPFFVMERLEGETLAERMRRVRRFSVSDALKITAAILDGISAAHEIGIVHRDIKPPNVILVSGDRPKILDFGVAKIADDPGVVTARGVAVGTPRYMSPEQARGESVDGRADIYSSGLLLFEMVSGVGPFDDARDSNELILAHIARVAPPLSSLVPGVTPELDAAVAGMLQKNLHRRPTTAREARDKLRAVLAKQSERASVRPRPAPLSVQPRSTVPLAANAGYSAPPPRAGELRPTIGTKTSFNAPPFSVAQGEFQATAISTFGSSPTEHASAYDASPPASGTSSIAAVVTHLGNTVRDPMSGALPSNRSGAPALEPAVVQTEILTPVPVPSAKETHTQLPRAPERPRSVTPPPVSPNLAPTHTSGRRTVPALLAIVIGTVVVAGGVWGIEAARRHARSSSASVRVPATGGDDPPREMSLRSRATESGGRALPRDASAAAPVPTGDLGAAEPVPAGKKREAAPRAMLDGRPRHKRSGARAEAAPEAEKSAAPKLDAPPVESAEPPPPVATGARPSVPNRRAEGALPQSGL